MFSWEKQIFICKYKNKAFVNVQETFFKIKKVAK